MTLHAIMSRCWLLSIIGGVGKEDVGRCFHVEVHWTNEIPCCCCACKCSSGVHTGVFQNLVPSSFQHVGPRSFEFLDHSEDWLPEDLIMPSNNQLIIAYSTEELSLLGNGSGRYILDLQRTWCTYILHIVLHFTYLFTTKCDSKEILKEIL